MSSITKSVAFGLGVVLLFSTSLVWAASGAGEASHQDLVKVILDTIESSGAGQDIYDQVHHNDEITQDMTDFLNRDFETKAFSRNTDITCEDIIFTLDGAKNHIGFVVVSFPSARGAVNAIKAATSIGRKNFKIMVLTVFRVFRLDNHFIIVYSETPRNAAVIDISRRLSQYFAGQGDL